ncbi:MAG: DUF3047 domain-containing protein [Nitrospirota bacterium]|nr:DUF3047 domain-containing protein [Nitrospirota bacterium]MDH5585558.1 DUF3047 domain-containing protein [Nitrospirota bacterium]MDH5773957.1 DUF3047 domain-containing protein [Nitrospirota bacterium]
MKRMKRTTQYFLGLFALASLSLMSSEISAISPYVQVSTFTESFTNPSSSILPKDWSVRVWQGEPDIEIVKESQRSVLKLRSHRSNVALYKKVHVDLDLHPNLSWEWKVTEWPIHGDARDGQLDDQAAGIYVMFPRFPGFFNTRVIGYLWESDAPQGTIVKSQNDSRIHYVVVRSGMQKVGEWVQEQRNVEQDYEQIYGEKAPPVGGVSLMIDSDHTQSSSESFFGNIYFSSMSMWNMGRRKE